MKGGDDWVKVRVAEAPLHYRQKLQTRNEDQFLQHDKASLTRLPIGSDEDSIVRDFTMKILQPQIENDIQVAGPYVGTVMPERGNGLH